jgi:hypothetical protein
VLNEGSGSIATEGYSDTTITFLGGPTWTGGYLNFASASSQCGKTTAIPKGWHPSDEFVWTLITRVRMADVQAAERNIFGLSTTSSIFPRYIKLQTFNQNLYYKIALGPVTATITEVGALTAGEWTTLAAVTRSATDHELYKDGVSLGTSNTDVDHVNMADVNIVSMGARFELDILTGTGFWNGDIEWAMLFNVDLSAYLNKIDAEPYAMFQRERIVQIGGVHDYYDEDGWAAFRVHQEVS